MQLLDAGYPVAGYSRTRFKTDQLVQAGLMLAESPRAATEAAEIVFTMVSDPQTLRKVTGGADGILQGLGPGKVHVEMSPVGPRATVEITAEVVLTGAQMLDAPVADAVATSEQESLRLLLVGGAHDAFTAVRPILQQLAGRVLYVGPSGSGALMMLATSLALSSQWAAFCEALLLAERGGIPRALAVEVLVESASPAVAARAGMVETPPEMPWFDIAGTQQDLRLALERVHALGVPLPLTAMTDQLLTICRGLGHGHQDLAALYHVLASLSGHAPKRPG
jgi:3-hydroxyisobutyrate dehydrogenase-like beta-hydroxyacid dehydrogenase